jgi:2-aminoethylphosphonate-pyruvate transaminase
MKAIDTINSWKDKILFTPGPLTTSRTVKQAMLRDLGSRDFDFISIVKNIRKKLVELAEVEVGNYEAVIMQGSGTFGIESVISSSIPPKGKLLVIINGAYGTRIAAIARKYNIETITLEYPENEIPSMTDIEKVLSDVNDITNTAVVHCETTTGIINPIKEIGEIVSKHKSKYFIDAMSSFGAVPINAEECNTDFIVSSSNKCIEGVPGFSFIIAKHKSLLECEKYSRTVCLDLFDQWKGLEASGQFRFTPPTHALLAFYQALQELEDEGGIAARAERYKKNYNTLINGMEKLGFEEYLPRELQGYIITSFLYPSHKNFSFDKFYSLLNNSNYVIYPGKLSKVDCFRIGNIGRITEMDIKDLMAAIECVLDEMGINLIET